MTTRLEGECSIQLSYEDIADNISNNSQLFNQNFECPPRSFSKLQQSLGKPEIDQQRDCVNDRGDKR